MLRKIFRPSSGESKIHDLPPPLNSFLAFSRNLSPTRLAPAFTLPLVMSELQGESPSVHVTGPILC